MVATVGKALLVVVAMVGKSLLYCDDCAGLADPFCSDPLAAVFRDCDFDLPMVEQNLNG